MVKKWSGDGTYELPAKQVEPYRLWFEFLKCALGDPEIKVNKNFYKNWGDVENAKFDDWWSNHWRNLFAVDIGTLPLSQGEAAKHTNSQIAVNLRLDQDIETTLRQVEALLRDAEAKGKNGTRSKGKFSLSEHSAKGFETRLNTARCMLRLYQYWLEFGELPQRKRVEKAALAYWDWVSKWDAQILEKGWNRPRPYKQHCFDVYGRYLREKVGGGSKRTMNDLSDADSYDAADARRMVVRYIRKARKIAENVAQGEFPGRY